MLVKIFGPKNGTYRLQDSEILGETENEYRILGGELIGNRSLGRPRGKWEVNIRMDLKGR
jgi:hypothetical protein